MKAIAQDVYGSTDVLKLTDVEKPEIGDHEVLVRVHAAGVDRGVWHLMTGRPYLVRLAGYGVRRPKYPIRGSDVAGRVEAIGKAVTSFQRGDAVMGTCDGSFAEYARVRQDRLVLMPANLTFEQAATVPTSATTALQALRDHGQIQSGWTVLIIGASGGVGTFAVQLAKAFGAEVTGVSSATKVDLVRSIGADHVIDYSREELADLGQRYDLILDIGGNRPLSQLRQLLKPAGTLVIVGGEGGSRWFGMGRQFQALATSPFVRQSLKIFIARQNREDLRFLTGLIDAGKIKPVVDRTYPLSGAPDAIRYLEEGHARGKLAITV